MSLLIPTMSAILASCSIVSVPADHSTQITGAAIGEWVSYTVAGGDVWTTTWADDGNLYTVNDDGVGFDGKSNGNLVISKITNDDPGNLRGKSVNTMAEYGKAGGIWKAMGLTCIDGTLYLSVGRHRARKGSVVPFQSAQDASIIKSTDHGKTWSRPEEENVKNPMFPGERFGTPYFVEYGKDYKVKDKSGNWVLPPHGGDKYVYAISNDGYWDNGNNIILGRVRRDEIGNLKGSDWQFYTGGDGMDDRNWSSDMNRASLLIDTPNKASMCSVQYITALNRYVMLQWHWVTVGGTHEWTTTVWDLYESPTPWGPWNAFYSYDSTPECFYNPCIAPKLISDDGLHMTVFAAGGFPTGKYYNFHAIPLTLRTDKPRPNTAKFISIGAATSDGKWVNLYGQDGYDIPALVSTRSLPDYVESLSYHSTNKAIVSIGSMPGGLQPPSGPSSRVLACNSGDRQYIDLTFKDDEPHRVAIYVCDCDSMAKDIVIEVLDGDTGIALDTRNVTDFPEGKWLKYEVGGHVKFRLTNVRVPSVTAVFQGIFFGW